MREDTSCVDYLIAKGSLVEVFDYKSRNILHLACLSGNQIFVQKFLADYPIVSSNLIQRKDENHDTPLVAAIKNGSYGLTKIYVDHPDCDVNTEGKDGITPLMLAITKKSAELVRILILSNKVNLDKRDHQGQTALHRAAIANVKGIIRLLLSNGASKSIPDLMGNFPYNLTKEESLKAALELPPLPPPSLKTTIEFPDDTIDNVDLDSIPSIIPEMLDKDSFNELISQGTNSKLFPPDIFSNFSDSNGFISRDKLFENSLQTDVFLLFDWELVQTNNHEPVLQINRALNKLGIITWYKEALTGDVIQQMCDGVERTQLILVFIHRNFIDRVNGTIGNDNCRFAFRYALRRKSAVNLLPIVIDESCLESLLWTGPVGMALGGSIYLNFVSITNFETAVHDLYKTITCQITPTLTSSRRYLAKIPSHLKERLSKKDFNELLSHMKNKDLFPSDIFDHFDQKGKIARQDLLNFAKQTDVLLLFSSGFDELHRDIRKRISLVRLLSILSLITIFIRR